MDFLLSSAVRGIGLAQFVLPTGFPAIVLQIGLYIPVLILLFVETKVCSDEVVRSMLIVATVILVVRIIFNLVLFTNAKEFYKIAFLRPLGLAKEEDEDRRDVSEGEEDPSVTREDEENHNISRRKALSLYCVYMLVVLVLVALSIFSTATLIKMVIPYRFSIRCPAKSDVSVAVLIVSVVPPIVVLLTKILTMAVYKLKKRISKPLSIMAAFILVLAGLVEFAIAIWFSARIVTGVWEGKGLDVYEVVTLYAILPLIRMW